MINEINDDDSTISKYKVNCLTDAGYIGARRRC